MHHYERAGGSRQIGVHLGRRESFGVVDDRDVTVDTPSLRGGLEGVDAKRYAPFVKFGYQRLEAADFLLGCDLPGVGTARRGSQLDDVRAIGTKFQRLFQCPVRVEIRAAVGERVLGYVDDADDGWPRELHRGPSRKACSLLWVFV